MAKIITPGATEQEKAIFAKFNIQLLTAVSEAEFVAEVVNYLNRHNVLELATCRNNEPRCTTLEYFNIGLTVHILAGGGGKMANLKENPMVCYTVHDPYNPFDDYFGAKGLQVWGTAHLFKKNDDTERARHLLSHSQSIAALKQMGIDQAINAMNFNILSIEPTRIRYLDVKKGFRNVTWYRKDSATEESD